MFSLRSLPSRKAPKSLRTRCLLLNNTPSRSFSLLASKRTNPSHNSPTPRLSFHAHLPTSRPFATKSTADSIIEEIQDQYATARDEFEIATEETEKKTLYAEDDRTAAREELDKLKGLFEDALKGSDGEEVKNRVGQRIRELENAVIALEKSAHDG